MSSFRFCGDCGARQAATARFCGVCGAPLGEMAPPPPALSSPARVGPPVSPPGVSPAEAGPAPVDDHTPARRESAPSPSPRAAPGGDLGRLLLRLGLGVLHVYPANPMAYRGVYDPALIEDVYNPWAFTEFWAWMAVDRGQAPVYDGVSVAMAVLGALVATGLFFRTACAGMALVLAGLTAFVFLGGSSLAFQMEYAVMALAFVGLLVLGPGRYRLGRRRA